MTSQPDKLFRDKLENFQRPAPVGAWDKIESNLATPLYKLVWLRVAAGIVLFAAAAIVLWPSEKSTIEIAETIIEQPATNHEANQPIVKTETKQGAPQKKQSEYPKTKNSVTLAKIKKELPVQQQINTKQDSVLVTPVPQELIAEVSLPEEKELPSKTIVYTTDVVNSKFLKKKLPLEATPESKEASGIQKLIGLAYAAKNSETTLSDLRQKKDDILALNFSKKKGEN